MPFIYIQKTQYKYIAPQEYGEKLLETPIHQMRTYETGVTKMAQKSVTKMESDSREVTS